MRPLRVRTKTFGMPPFLPNKALTRFGVGLVGKKGRLEWHHVRYSMNVDVASCFLYCRFSRTSSETLCLEVGSHPQPGTVKTVARDELLRSVDKKLVKHLRSSFGRCLFDTLFCSEVDFFSSKEKQCSGTKPGYWMFFLWGLKHPNKESYLNRA